MDIQRKRARDMLIHSTKTKFYAILDEAKISPLQYKIMVGVFVEHKSRVQLSLENFVCVETIRNEIAKAYDNIKGVLL